MMSFSAATNALALKFSGVARASRLLTCATGAAAMVVGTLWVTGFSFLNTICTKPQLNIETIK